MCLIVLAYRQHPRYRLIVAANRDEFYRRPTAQAAFWSDQPEVLAGRDLEQGGTWLGTTKDGRFAALTNYRDPAAVLASARSRGELVSDFLRSRMSPAEYLSQVDQTDRCYNGFNLLVGDTSALLYYSNRTGGIEELGSGIYGLSNHLLDTPWPKVTKAKAALAESVRRDEVASEELFAILGDRTQPPDAVLPDTGVGMEWERMLAPAFIASPEYGTRSSTMVLVAYDGSMQFIERTMPGNREVAFHFNIA
ncbi:MAG: NRDE family protein [Negativicutes bacterium]|nr:NRDE family protein [Negativicutes bacterium]